jgi:conjugative transfer signal peptidase TraF
MLAAVAITAIALSRGTLLIMNVTSSVPVGLYLTSSAELARGDFVLIARDTLAHRAALSKGLISPSMQLLKRVAGLPGDHVCRHGRSVWINGIIKASARNADDIGRPLRTWRGCRVLDAGEIFVLGSHANSFDSRSFGPIRRSDVVSRVVLIWPF